MALFDVYFEKFEVPDTALFVATDANASEYPKRESPPHYRLGLHQVAADLHKEG